MPSWNRPMPRRWWVRDRPDPRIDSREFLGKPRLCVHARNIIQHIFEADGAGLLVILGIHHRCATGDLFDAFSRLGRIRHGQAAARAGHRDLGKHSIGRGRRCFGLRAAGGAGRIGRQAARAVAGAYGSWEFLFLMDGAGIPPEIPVGWLKCDNLPQIHREVLPRVDKHVLKAAIWWSPKGARGRRGVAA